MKKITKIILLVFLISLFSIFFAACNTRIGNLDYEFTETEAIVKYYNDSTTSLEVIVPAEVNGLPVTKIDNFGIADSNYLERIVIGKNVREISDIAIKNNGVLEHIDVHPDNIHFKSVDGVLYTADGKELVAYPAYKGLLYRDKINDKGEKEYDPFSGKVVQEGYITSYSIIEGCERIRPYAIYHVRALEELIMPDSVKFIGEAAMLMDSGFLKNIVLSKNLEHISKDAFAKNSGLKSITIHSKIKNIDSFAFFNCTSLRIINFCGEAGITYQPRWKPTDKGSEITTFDPKKHKEADKKNYLVITYNYLSGVDCK